jgi:hypothetical protein
MLPFHLEYLGFTFDWEHQFEPGLPPYAQISLLRLRCTRLSTTAMAASWRGQDSGA